MWYVISSVKKVLHSECEGMSREDIQARKKSGLEVCMYVCMYILTCVVECGMWRMYVCVHVSMYMYMYMSLCVDEVVCGMSFRA
jgi:hypothetical protein